ncbi:MAG: DUF6249 domain-containing protein [Flavobacteriales bacterium]
MGRRSRRSGYEGGQVDGFAETGRVTDAGHPASDEHNNQNTMLATEAITGITFFAAAFGTVYVVVNARHRQRMAMIEKGMDPNAGARPQTLRSLRSGMLLLGFGLGLFLGHLLDRAMYVSEDSTPLPYFTMLLVCGGLSLIIFHLIARKRGEE